MFTGEIMLLAANPVLHVAAEYWRGLTRPGMIPDIRQIIVADIPRAIMPHMIIAETTQGNFDLSRLRLCGHEIARWFREFPEGMESKAFAALTDAAYTRHMHDLLDELLLRRRPVYGQSIYTLPGLLEGEADMTVTADRLAMPLADGGSRVECVIVVETLKASDERAGPLRILPPPPGTPVVHSPYEPVA